GGHIVFDRVWFSYQRSGTPGGAAARLGALHEASLAQASTDSASEDGGSFEQPASGSGGDYVLRDISFDVAPGERVGIVGGTRVGETNRITLVARFSHRM